MPITLLSSTMPIALDELHVSQHASSHIDTYLPRKRPQHEDPDILISRLQLQKLSVDGAPRAPRHVSGRGNGPTNSIGDKREQHSDRPKIQPRARCTPLILLLCALFEVTEILTYTRQPFDPSPQSAYRPLCCCTTSKIQRSRARKSYTSRTTQVSVGRKRRGRHHNGRR